MKALSLQYQSLQFSPPMGIYDLVEPFSKDSNTIYWVYIAAKQLISVGQDYNFFQHM